jgi:hypothetical protein
LATLGAGLGGIRSDISLQETEDASGRHGRNLWHHVCCVGGPVNADGLNTTPTCDIDFLVVDSLRDHHVGVVATGEDGLPPRLERDRGEMGRWHIRMLRLGAEGNGTSLSRSAHWSRCQGHCLHLDDQGVNQSRQARSGSNVLRGCRIETTTSRRCETSFRPLSPSTAIPLIGDMKSTCDVRSLCRGDADLAAGRFNALLRSSSPHAGRRSSLADGAICVRVWPGSGRVNTVPFRPTMG